MDQYHLPKPEDLFASLVGGQKFSKLNLLSANMPRRGVTEICDYQYP